jgi:predicted ATPase
MRPPRLWSLRIRNFKAIRDSRLLRLEPFTVLIGNNGSGKSSVLEALETLQTCVAENIDAAVQLWRGIGHVRNKAKQLQIKTADSGELRATKPIVFQVSGRFQRTRFRAETSWNERGGENELFFEQESVRFGDVRRERDANKVRTVGGEESRPLTLPSGKSLLNLDLGEFITAWQFLALTPQAMGAPTPQTRSRGRIRLARDGANIAEFLLDIRSLAPAAFDGIVETLRTVLPFASDVQPAVTSELERTVYLQLTEADFKVPGWLLSSGTLRILALLALLRHPTPPPLIAIEEIENGLDPRTVHLLVEEIRAAVQAGRTQVVATTHSPYLLDLVPLSSLVLVERVDGEPRFTRPADSDQVQQWAKSFAPGQLYTMNRLHTEVAS